MWILLISCIFSLSAEYGEDEEDDEMAPTPKRRKLCSQLGLETSLESGLYPDSLGREGPVEDHRPDCNSALDYLLLLWPELLTFLIASETKLIC